MDRDYVHRLLANARTRATHTFTLPHCGEQLTLFTTLTNDEKLRVGTASGSDEDQMARLLTGMLRFLLIDDDGDLLLHSFAEASGFVSALHDDDFEMLFSELQTIAEASEAAEDHEAGKAS